MLSQVSKRETGSIRNSESLLGRLWLSSTVFSQPAQSGLSAQLLPSGDRCLKVKLQAQQPKHTYDGREHDINDALNQI